MMRLLFLVLLLLALTGSEAFSQTLRATTDDGRKVLLKENGQWQFVDAANSTTDAGNNYEQLKKSMAVFKTKGNKIQVYYNPTVWKQEAGDDPTRTVFHHKDGDVYGLVIAERVSMTLDALKEVALNNAKSVAPDTRIIFEEMRKVGGKTVLCMQMEGTIDGIPFTYYGYYYTGKAGTLQLLTYTSQNLFSEYQKEMASFLNGLVINE